MVRYAAIGAVVLGLAALLFGLSVQSYEVFSIATVLGISPGAVIGAVVGALVNKAKA
ncbi:MAG: hypothetical protein HC872_01090 [Gammaproteobacteria bacterium]|nr:hypothetical protein [Gammaproteobacteria bacterium]